MRNYVLSDLPDTIQKELVFIYSLADMPSVFTEIDLLAPFYNLYYARGIKYKELREYANLFTVPELTLSLIMSHLSQATLLKVVKIIIQNEKAVQKTNLAAC